MQTFDIVTIIVIILAVAHGVWRGLVWQVAALASIFVSFFVACHFGGIIAPRIPAEPPWNVFIAMLLIYIVTALVIWSVCQLLRSFIERVKLKEFDRQMGGILGFIKGVVLCALITLMATTLMGQATRESVMQSVSGRYIALAMTRSVPFLPDEVRNYLDPYLQKAFGDPEQIKTPELPDFLSEPDTTPQKPTTTESLEDAARKSREFIESFEATSEN